jgi:hypothetical protein
MCVNSRVLLPGYCIKLSIGPSTTGTQGADKSLARPGRKQATATEGFDFLISYL